MPESRREPFSLFLFAKACLNVELLGKSIKRRKFVRKIICSDFVFYAILRLYFDGSDKKIKIPLDRGERYAGFRL